MFPAKVLVAMDGSPEAIPALEAAVDLASGTGSELHVVHVVSTVPMMPYPGVAAQKKSDAYLERRRLGGLRLLEYQAGRVRDLGCAAAQGYLYSPPVRFCDFERWVDLRQGARGDAVRNAESAPRGAGPARA